MSKTNLQQQITVHALPSKVWKVLTGPEYVKQYFFTDNVQCAWTEGSLIFLTSEDGDQPVRTGQVLESVPGILLRFNFRDTPASVSVTTTYELIITGDGVELKMKWEGFTDTSQEYLIRVQQARLVLQKIKWLSEYS